MKQHCILLLAFFGFPFLSQAQTPTAGNLPKDAQVNVVVKDERSGNVLESEIVIFRSQKNGTEFQGLTNASGAFTLRLPAGSKYDYFVLGFQDSLSKNLLDIPALKENAYYKAPFNVTISLDPPASFVIEGCTFETGKADLKEEAYPVLDHLVDYLKRKDDERIEVGGHTDNVGKADANMILSTNRANTVRNYLISKGIAPERIVAKGYGMTEPIEDNTTAEGRAVNRRTEVKIL